MAQKKHEETATTEDEFKTTADLINKEKGERVLRSLHEKRESHTLEGGLSSGSISLDYAINPRIGGMKWGQLLQLYGKKSGGKSTIALGFAANCTTVHKKHVLYLDLEGTVDEDMVFRSGVDHNFFTFVEEDGREAALILERMMRAGDVGLVVIDSLAWWEPEVIAKKGSSAKDMVDFTQPKMAYQGSFVTQAIKKLCRTSRKTGTIVISINQVRSNLDPYSGELSLVPYGPHALDHAISVQCLVKGKPRGKSAITNEDGELIGQYTQIIVDKNKTAVPMKEAEVPLIFGVGVNPYMEIATLAQQYGVVNGTAGNFKWAESGENIVRGTANFVSRLANEPDLCDLITDKLIQVLGINYLAGKPVNAYQNPFVEDKNPHLKLLKNNEN